MRLGPEYGELRKKYWSTELILQDKLYGNQKELQRSVSFIIEKTLVSVMEQERTHSPTEQVQKTYILAHKVRQKPQYYATPTVILTTLVVSHNVRDKLTMESKLAV
ncbi:hypothetical protein BsWGS_25763 [Bradybaena similaris]